MKKILLSVSVIAAVAAVVFGITTAFFSDTETSTGNTFTAGAIDLKIDNDSWYNGQEWTSLSWQPSDLAGHLFFDFADLKPGDWGEDTISIIVHNNPAWLCATITLTSNTDNTCTEPEGKDENKPNPGECDPIGELADELYFIWWADDGDNVLEVNEGVIGTYKLGDAWLNQSHTIAISDNQTNILETGVLKGDTTYHIGKAWCYGTLTTVPVSDNTGTNPGQSPGPGILCNGQPVTNKSQTDSATLDISFYAVQSRHNEGFVCSAYYGKETFLRLENKDQQYNPILGDSIEGKLWFKSPYPTFDYTLQVSGLQVNTDYWLHYYADPWNGKNGIAIAGFKTDGSGNYSGSGSVELNTDLPVAVDTNHPWAKIWVIPQSHWGGTGVGMTQWDQTKYLWEWNKVQYNDTQVP